MLKAWQVSIYMYSEMGRVLSPGSPTDAGMITLCEIIVLL